MDWLNSVLPTDGNSSHIIKLVQDATASAGTKLPWVIAAIGSVCTHMLDAFCEMFWIVIVLWLADMVLGNLRALVDKEIPWSASKSLDGVIRVIVYVILGVCLVLIEDFVFQASGANVEGILLGGGYAVCALGEARSLVRHFTYFIPGFSTFGNKMLRALQQLTNGKDKKP